MAGPGGFNADGLGYALDDRNFRVHQISGQNRTAELGRIPADQFLSDPGGLKTSTLVLVESTSGFQPDGIVNLGATRDSIEKIRHAWGIPSAFMAKLSKPGSLSCVVHSMEYATSSSEGHREKTALNMGFRWGKGHDSWVVVFGRYDLRIRTLRMVASSREVLGKSGLEGLLRETCISLQANPLVMFSLLFELCGRHVDNKTQRYDIRMSAIANSLEIADKDWALSWGIKSPESTVNLSKDIYQALDDTRWQHKASQQLVEIGERCSEIISAATRSGTCSNAPLSLVCEEINDILHRIRLNHHMLLYIERMLQSQFQLHQNLLANQEAKATGRIAVAGLETRCL
ncbi:hypothetical protein V8F20_006927 [Naviculisporaceae sp. PSN 640]